MNILVSNDDGYFALGIKILFQKLVDAGHKVFMLAPSKNRSAISHGIIMNKRLEVKKVGENAWSCSGTPADCVITALKSPLFLGYENKIDLLISGINCGANMGTDIIYSGTCAAARQGSLFGIPSVALSIDFTKTGEKNIFYERMADFAVKNLDVFKKILENHEKDCFLNVNGISSNDENCWKKAVFSKYLSVREYDDKVFLSSKENDSFYETEFMGTVPNPNHKEHSDYFDCENGDISVSAVQVEPAYFDLKEIDFNTAYF